MHRTGGLLPAPDPARPPARQLPARRNRKPSAGPAASSQRDALDKIAAPRPTPACVKPDHLKPVVGVVEAVQHIGFGVFYGHVPGFGRVQWYVESRRPTGTPGVAMRAANTSPVPMPCRVRPTAECYGTNAIAAHRARLLYTIRQTFAGRDVLRRVAALRLRCSDNVRRGAARLRRRGWAASPISSAQGCPTKSGSAPANAVRTTPQRVLCEVRSARPAMRKALSREQNGSQASHESCLLASRYPTAHPAASALEAARWAAETTITHEKCARKLELGQPHLCGKPTSNTPIHGLAPGDLRYR